MAIEYRPKSGKIMPEDGLYGANEAIQPDLQIKPALVEDGEEGLRAAAWMESASEYLTPDATVDTAPAASGVRASRR